MTRNVPLTQAATVLKTLSVAISMPLQAAIHAFFGRLAGVMNGHN